MKRREFLGIVGVGAFHKLALPKFGAAQQSTASAIAAGVPSIPSGEQAGESKPYGSGHFGEWITDQFGLPAYRYTCNQVTDPKAVTPVHKQWRGPTDHTHQVGNDRVIAAVSNFGYVQVRQDEGSPKFLNDYSPEHAHFGAGIGFLTDGEQVLSTYYPGHGESFERIMGEGYFRKTVRGQKYAIDQVIYAPFGDDPVLISAVTVTNHDNQGANLSLGSNTGAATTINSRTVRGCKRRCSIPRMARSCVVNSAPASARVSHHAKSCRADRNAEISGSNTRRDAVVGKSSSLAEEGSLRLFWRTCSRSRIQSGDGRSQSSEHFSCLARCPRDGFATDASAFFGSGGVDHPAGLSIKLNNDASSTGPASAMLLERHLSLRPQESRTLFFLYGYLPQGFEIDALVAKYSADPAGLLSRSSAAWKADGVRFSTPAEPWAERETSWHNYYLRSNLTYDSFFREHIISQGHVYQYVIGFQGAARDPLQHTLPFIFSKPETARAVIRYTLKEIQADGSIPYGIVGSGVPMPAIFHPSDQEMWLLWTASEYVLATRDKSFLDEKIPIYPRQVASSTDPTVRDLLQRSYIHLTQDIGVGKHGLMRLSNGDWNDDVVVLRSRQHRRPDPVKVKSVSKPKASSTPRWPATSSTTTRGMLAYAGDTKTAEQARAKAEAQRVAVLRAGKGSGSVERGWARSSAGSAKTTYGWNRSPGQSLAE